MKDDKDPPVTAISSTEKPTTGSLAVNVKLYGLSLVVVVVFIFKLDILVAPIDFVGFFVSIIIFLLKDNDPLSPGVGRATLAALP